MLHRSFGCAKKKMTREYVPAGNMNVNAGHPAAAPDPWQDWCQRHQISVPPSVSSRDSQMPVYGNQGDQSCGQGFIGPVVVKVFLDKQVFRILTK